MNCLKCNAQLPEGCMFCPECGTAQNAAPTPPCAPQPSCDNPPPPAPNYSAPNYNAPNHGAPNYNAPNYGAPNYSAPNYGAPNYQQPKGFNPAPTYVTAPPNYAPGYGAPANRLNTSRSLIKFILLNIVTLGIYSIVFYSNISTSINAVASRYDGRRTMHYCLVFFLLSSITLGIVPLVWFHKLSGRIGRELARRNIAYGFGAGTFWLWNILGACIVVGPFIYLHKLSKAMNLLCADYNQKG